MKVASGNVLWRQRKRNWCRTPFTFTVYTLTDRELSVKTGILNERFNLIKLFRIVDISVERTFLQRIFGMSTLVLDTRDQSSGNGVVALKNVINGFEVRQVLQQLAQVLPAGSVVVLDTMARCAVGQAQWHASVGQTQAQFHWGITQMQELTACHPRLQLRQSHSVAANHGWMGVAMEAMWNPWGHHAPLYGVAELVLQ